MCIIFIGFDFFITFRNVFKSRPITFAKLYTGVEYEIRLTGQNIQYQTCFLKNGVSNYIYRTS